MAVAIPLAEVADRWVRAMAGATRSDALAGIDGATLLGERAMFNRFRIPGRISAGGGCRLYDAADGAVALNLARPDDRDLLPALFAVDAVTDIAGHIGRCPTAALVARGRLLGLAIAHDAETPPPAVAERVRTPPAPPPSGRPRVLDLSALWAGPLAGHLLRSAGAHVTRVDSPVRPDNMRHGDPALHALLNGGKARQSLNLSDPQDRAALLALIAASDIVIESARPRALRQFGVDAAEQVRANPGLTWLSITAHGAAGEAENWTGFGDDCAVAGGLTAALRRATGRIGFVADAVADPLTGIAAARAGWEAWARGGGVQLAFAMSGVVAQAMAEVGDLHVALTAWAGAAGQPFPQVRRRQPAQEPPPPGQAGDGRGLASDRRTPC